MVATRIVATVLTTTTAGLLCAASPAHAEGNATDIAAAVPQVSTEGALGAQDTEFRALFADWKSMENRDTGRVSIPSRKPVDAFKLTSQYGFRADPFAGRRARHKGLDMAGPIGTPIYATADGIVGRAQWVGGYGQYVEVNHGGEIQTRYGHLSQILVICWPCRMAARSPRAAPPNNRFGSLHIKTSSAGLPALFVCPLHKPALCHCFNRAIKQ